MKLYMTIIALMVSSIMTAQNLFTAKTSLPQEVKEEYLGGLFKECKLIYCESDSLSEMVFRKEMEVHFVDTTFFFSARIYSSVFTKNTYAFDVYGCDSIRFDDGGSGLIFNGKDLQNLPYLKSVLDVLVRQTPFVKYIGDYYDPED